MQRNVIIAGSAVGLLALMGLLYSGAFGTFGNVQGLPEGTQICDVKGTLSATVYDTNAVKYVDNVSLNAGSSNCHAKGIAEFNLASGAQIPTAAFTPGSVTIYINIVDKDTRQVWGSDSFKVDTGFFEFEKQFVHNFAFNKLPKGEQFEIVVLSSWEGDKPEFVKTITV